MSTTILKKAIGKKLSPKKTIRYRSSNLIQYFITSFLQDTSMEDRVIILLGPTGVGKTGASLVLAKALDTEIISADSMVLYKKMDTATAKPTSQQLKEVKHHLIDILEPHESFSAGLFRERACRIITDLHTRNKIPLIVGGTGLYIRTLTQGLFKCPEADWHLRAYLQAQEREKGDGYLYQYLETNDQYAAQTIHPSDKKRIIRALEIHLKEKKNRHTLCSETTPAPYQFIIIGLNRNRQELYHIIDTRVDTMIEQGLIEETKRLRTLTMSKTAMQALGYKEINMYLHGSVSLHEAITILKKRTRHYAKRQLTWFRKEPYIHWVDITGLYNSNEIFRKILKDVEIVRKIIYHEPKSVR
jgi:tRNA dimethylallyltransferase